MSEALDSIPLPRETVRLFGHDTPWALFRDAVGQGRAHHAWLLTGPRGIGKASFAHRAAALVLGEDTAPLVASGSHPALRVLTRRPNEKTGKLSAQIVVGDIREMEEKLVRRSAPDGGWRVVIIDAAEDMNPSAANALLKTLEEPPARFLFLLVSHAPGRLLPTIRSRCRVLPLDVPSAEDGGWALAAAAPDLDMVAAGRLLALAEGSPGEALRLQAQGGDAVYGELVALLSDLPRSVDRAALTALAEQIAPRDRTEAFEAWVGMLLLFIARLARASALGAPPAEAAEGESALITRLGPLPDAAQGWATLAARIESDRSRVLALNLDRRLFIIGAIRAMEATAQRAARQGALRLR